MIERMILVVAAAVVAGLLSLWAGYHLGQKRLLAAEPPPHAMAVFYLTLLKMLDEGRYADARSGIAMMASIQVYNCRTYEKKLSAE